MEFVKTVVLFVAGGTTIQPIYQATIFVHTKTEITTRALAFDDKGHEKRWFDFFKKQHTKNDLTLIVWHVGLN